MARTEYPSIGEITDQVLREIQAEEQIKTAERTILRGATAPKTSDLAAGLLKLAAQCRSVDVENPTVTYDDLAAMTDRCR